MQIYQYVINSFCWKIINVIFFKNWRTWCNFYINFKISEGDIVILVQEVNLVENLGKITIYGPGVATEDDVILALQFLILLLVLNHGQ